MPQDILETLMNTDQLVEPTNLIELCFVPKMAGGQQKMILHYRRRNLLVQDGVPSLIWSDWKQVPIVDINDPSYGRAPFRG